MESFSLWEKVAEGRMRVRPRSGCGFSLKQNQRTYQVDWWEGGSKARCFNGLRNAYDVNVVRIILRISWVVWQEINP